METKNKEIVSAMREKIVRQSIKSLQKEGLRFSVDELATELKVSKKTIYKYFATKEELAIAIYQTLYEDLEKQVSACSVEDKRQYVQDLLEIYYQSLFMVRGDIFNKYVLNENLRTYALGKHNALRAKIAENVATENIDCVMTIIDGALKEACVTNSNRKEIIGKLAEWICL